MYIVFFLRKNARIKLKEKTPAAFDERIYYYRKLNTYSYVKFFYQNTHVKTVPQIRKHGR